MHRNIWKMSIVSNVCIDTVNVYPVKSESLQLLFASTSSLFDYHVSPCLEIKDDFVYFYKFTIIRSNLKTTVTVQITAHCFLEISSRISFL